MLFFENHLGFLGVSLGRVETILTSFPSLCLLVLFYQVKRAKF